MAGAAPFGVAGIGQHLAQRVWLSHRSGALRAFFASGMDAAAPAGGAVITDPLLPWINRMPHVRWSLGRKGHLGSDRFDRAVAARLPEDGRLLAGFGGQSLLSMRRARTLGYRTLELQSAGSHADNVWRRQSAVLAEFDYDQGWLGRAARDKMRAEYELADVIYVASRYSHESFVEAGVPEAKLRRVSLQVADRFKPGGVAPQRFTVVYVGSISAMKGVPVLIEAFGLLADPDARLRLVGGVSTRRMRQWLGQRMDQDPRIIVRPGDPLPVYQQASVYVHPSFDDGWGYAPAEALACGVPLIVTDCTGMSESVEEGRNGVVVPPGDVEAILEALRALGAT